MNKKATQEINADLIQGKKDNETKKNMIETMSNENKFINIDDRTTYNNYKLLTADKKDAKNRILTSFLETDKQSDISIQFQLNRERIRSFAASYGGKMVKLVNNGSTDGNIFYITNFGDAIKKYGGMNNLSKTCNSTPIEINYEYVENYQYNKYRGNYLISTSNGKASTSTSATLIKVLDHTMPEFHPCGMEDTFVYVGLNKSNNYRHGLTNTNPNRNKNNICINDNVKIGPRTILENKTVSECRDIASIYNSKYASAAVGKYSNNEMVSQGINDYSYNKTGIKYFGIKNKKQNGRGQCILISNNLDSRYKYYKWRSKPEYLGCWGDWEDNTWGFTRSRAMTWIHRGRNLSFFKCQKECNRRGFDIWGLQYAVGPGKSGQCMCAHESQKHKWGKYGGANNCTWDRNTGVYVGGGWSNAIYRNSTNPRPQDSCSANGGTGNVISFYEAEQFKEDNLGKNAYIDRESISHDLSVANTNRIFYLNDAKRKNKKSNGCNLSSAKHNEITSKEWESLKKNTGKPKTCIEKQRSHDYNPLVRATTNLVNVGEIVENKNRNIDIELKNKLKNINNASNNISKYTEQANTIFNALKNPITSGFDNPKNNNLNNITNMVNNIIQNITGKSSIIEGHENDCHSTANGNDGICGLPITGQSGGHMEKDHDSDKYKAAFREDIESKKILETIKNYFISQPTFEAQREFTLLDVNSKKQWMYIWGALIISILSLKFYIMAKK